MGCTSTKQENGGVIPINGMAPSLENKPQPGGTPTGARKPAPLKGDLSMRRDARKNRQRALNEWRNRRVNAAEEMSHKLMDEKELLTVGSLRSRGTSRTTSRAPSPGPSQPYTNGLGHAVVDDNSQETLELSHNNNTNKEASGGEHYLSRRTAEQVSVCSNDSRETETTNITVSTAVPEACIDNSGSKEGVNISAGDHETIETSPGNQNAETGNAQGNQETVTASNGKRTAGQSQRDESKKVKFKDPT